MSKPRNDLQFSSGRSSPKDAENVPVPIDLDRMKAALSSETIKAPLGMTLEEKISFILQHSK